MELTEQQKQQILQQIGRPDWRVVGSRPETQKVQSRDENNNTVSVDQPTGNIILSIIGPNGQPDTVTVKPAQAGQGSVAIGATIPWQTDPATGQPVQPSTTPTVVQGPQNTPTKPTPTPAPQGWTDVTGVRNADGTTTYYGKDPADGMFKKVPGLPNSAAATSTTTRPVTPTAQLDVVKSPDGTPIAYRDPSTGQTIELPKTTPDKPQIIQGPRGQILKWDGTSLTTLQQGEAAPEQPKDGDTRQSVIPGTQYIGREVYHNGVWSIDTSYAPQPYVPTDKPKEGDVRPNVVSGQSVQEVYRGGSWVIDPSVPPKPFVPQPPEVLNTGTGPNIVMRNPQTGELTTTPNPNTTDVAARVTQLQTAASKQRDALNAQVLNGTLTKEQAAQQFDTWWETNITPQEQQLQQQQATQTQDAQFRANADARAQAAEDRANLTTAQTAGQNAAQRAEAMMPYMVGPGFGAALNNIQKAYATGKAPGNIDLGSAVTFDMPDLNSIAETATAQALAHLSPTAASKIGAPMPSVPQGIDIAGALNKSNYAPTTTIAPDGTVTIQHAPVSQTTPQPAFAQSGIPEGVNRQAPLPNPVDPSEFIGNYVPSM